MKCFLLGLSLAITAVSSAVAQEQTPSPQWSSDIIVKPVSGEAYRNVRVSQAYNGDIYLGREVKRATKTQFDSWEVFKSTDKGVTWNVFYSGQYDDKITAFDMICAGTGSDFRLYVARAFQDTSANENFLFVYSYEATGASSAVILQNATSNPIVGCKISAISLATDYKAKSSNATKYTISMAYVKNCTLADSLMIASSQASTTDLSNKRLYYTYQYIRRLSNTVGSSSGSTYGRGMAAWHETSTDTTDYGSIKAHLYWPDNGEAIANPINVVNSSASAIYKNPTVAITQSTAANEFKMVMLFEKNDGSLIMKSFDTLSNYAPVTAYLEDAAQFTVAASTGVQPYVAYDPQNTNFLMTYYNTSNGSLPYLLKGYSSAIAAAPTVFKDNYRNTGTAALTNAWPRLDFVGNPGTAAIFAWNENVTMFDYENAVGIKRLERNLQDVRVYPNPASSVCNIAFQAIQSDNVSILITDVSGRVLQEENAYVKPGANNIQINLDEMPAGNYMIQIKGANTNVAERLAIAH